MHFLTVLFLIVFLGSILIQTHRMENKHLKHTSFFFALAALFFTLAPAGYALDWNKTEIEQHAGIGESLPPYVFTCANTGAAAVTIAKILPSCGCLAPALDKKRSRPANPRGSPSALTARDSPARSSVL